MNTIKILLVTFVKNEGTMLSHFINHYYNEVDQILIHNDNSTDNSMEQIKEIYHNIEIVTLTKVPTPEKWESFLLRFTNLRNNSLNIAREKGFDLVIIVDADEFLNPPVGFSSLRSYLNWFASSKFAAVRAIGFDIIGNKSQYPETIELGFLEAEFRNMVRYKNMMDKPCIFNTKKCQSISFAPGAHNANINAAGEIWSPISPILLHYKFISLEYARSRVSKNNQTISDPDFNIHKSRAQNIDILLESLL